MTMKNQNDKHKERVSRYNQRFKILVSRDDFQKDIARFRKKWEIDPDKLKSTDEHQAWWHQHYVNADNWERDNWPKYRQELIELQKAAIDVNNKSVTYIQYLDRQKEINDMRIINAYFKDLREFLAKYKLPPKWKQAVQSYIFSNEAQYRGPVGLTIRTSFVDSDDDVEKDEVSIVLDAYTTKQELMDEWPRIKFHLDKLKHKQQNKFQPIDDEVFKRNRQAYTLKQQGKTYEQIAKKLSEDYDTIYSYEDIPTMIRNYKKLSGIN